MKYSRMTYALYGEVTLRLRGRDVSGCIVQLQQRGIPLRSVRVHRDSGQCRICLKDFDDVYSICRAHHVRFRIEHRQGIPFWKKRVWHRKMFALGALLFVCIIYGMSSIIWRVDVLGVEDQDGVAQIRDAAKSVGLYVGQQRSKLGDPFVLQEKILAKASDFVWVGLRTSGSVATIQALQKVEGTKQSSNTPHDIVATEPAVIRSVAATRGRVLVKANQYVYPGQVLISGTLAEGQKSVPASGDVLAEVWYTSKLSVPLKVIKSGLTGESVTRDYLLLGNWRVRVWGFKEPHFTASYERDSTTEWSIHRLLLPVQLQHVQLYEATQSAEQQSLQAAKQKALQLASADVQTQVKSDATVLGQSVLHEQVSHGTLYETVLTRVEQNIGVAAAIPAPKEPAGQTGGSQG
ncbi:sporulation protein YqfD [Alicyclobacillus fastidiosus]|uniref:Sporulation protein YqfD n=1 Tax=Alicyclobacillus fastidiosus TaxID=392011 RepID=A0ABY6ZLQ6_9BACL|nr:sporulation protein YqfD [Alicyclobacillus fastidiosus]WAH43794.1 sporulation protein YqfD [Alicyclobacillus fastidiosus]GMA60020.1 sporulation protein YqfD [Alicyclobacillus fastidiosus]